MNCQTLFSKNMGAKTATKRDRACGLMLIMTLGTLAVPAQALESLEESGSVRSGKRRQGPDFGAALDADRGPQERGINSWGLASQELANAGQLDVLLSQQSTPETLPPENQSDPERTPEAVEVTEIIVEGNTVFDEATIQTVLAPYEGQFLTVADLEAAANDITQLYIERGYITSRASVPEQMLDRGIVVIAVVEGFLEDLRVIGTDRLAVYIRSRVSLGVGKPLNQQRLEDHLRLLDIDPLFSRVEARLTPGTVEGGTILIVEAEEALPFSGNIGFDTLSPSSVGEYRYGAALQYRNLFGLGGTLFSSAYRTTTGGSEAYELGYRVPLNAMNGTLQLRVAPSNFEITDPDEPGFVLDQSGSTDIYAIGFRQPVIRTPREELALGLDFRYRDGSTLIPGFVIPPTRTSVFSFSQDYTLRDLSGVWAARSQFRVGTGLFDAGAPDGGRADETFFSWLGQLQRVQVINPDNLLFISADVQLSPESLLSSEQFYIGGGQSVRGYGQNARFGDNGIRLSIEDRITVERTEAGDRWLEARPFIDMGYVWNTGDDSFFDQTFLLGTGFGLTIIPFEGLSASVDLGIPLIELDQVPSDSPSDPRVYFDIDYQF